MARAARSRLNNRAGANITHNGRNSARAGNRAFAFLELNQRQEKPRTLGLTEIRGPYYTPMGRRYLADVLETMGWYVDSLKFAGGSFALMPRAQVRELIETAHRFNV